MVKKILDCRMLLLAAVYGAWRSVIIAKVKENVQRDAE